MPIHENDPLTPKDGTETPPEVFFQSRRKWMKRIGLGTAAIAGGGVGAYLLNRPSGEPDEVIAAGRSQLHRDQAIISRFPATPDPRFDYDRPETLQHEAARYTNFYEFSRFKSCWRHVEPFEPAPWEVVIDGLCEQPLKLDLHELFKRYGAEFRERQYRHRCVERWAMAVPWTGFPLRALLKDVGPSAKATHVRFVSFDRPKQASNQSDRSFPWPYVEGLTLAEAMNELTFVAVGVYGEPLLKQHGAPLRMVVPWKYGYKSPKSVQRIELVSSEPKTFWTELKPRAYPFESNVDPGIARPWSQQMERMLGTQEPHETQKFNGYSKWVAKLYS